MFITLMFGLLYNNFIPTTSQSCIYTYIYLSCFLYVVLQCIMICFFILIGDQQHLSTSHSSLPMQNKGKVFILCVHVHAYVCVCGGLIMTECPLLILPTKLAVTAVQG